MEFLFLSTICFGVVSILVALSVSDTSPNYDDDLPSNMTIKAAKYMGLYATIVTGLSLVGLTITGLLYVWSLI
jgi:hypothetical protein